MVLEELCIYICIRIHCRPEELLEDFCWKRCASDSSHQLGADVEVVQSNIPMGFYDNKMTCAAKNKVMFWKSGTNLLGWFVYFNVCNTVRCSSCSIMLLWYVLILCSCMQVRCKEGHSKVKEEENLFLKRRAVFTSLCRQLSRQKTFSYLILCMGEQRQWKLRNRNVKCQPPFLVC